MKVYVLENRDVDDNYMAIEDVFKDEQLAVDESKLIGEPFWHEIIISEHNMKYLTDYVYVVQIGVSLDFKVFSSKREAKAYADSINVDYKHIVEYKIK